MKVLIACEESQEVCKAFRAKGHEAYSCDIQEPSGGHPEWHILGDALKAIEGGQIVTMDGVTHDVGKWDLLIAHPPCTYLSNAGARHLWKGHELQADRVMLGIQGRDLFMRFWWAVEQRGTKKMHLTLYGDPRTKKNSARILKSRSGGRFVAPSKAYVNYETDCLRQIKRPRSPISARVNVRCVYYMKTARRVDLANLIEATTDILVKARVLEDDNSKIVAAHDGSRVDYDKQNPRVEIWIEEMEG